MSKQIEIFKVLFNNNKTKSWLHDELRKIGIDRDLQYLLDETRCKSFDVTIYEAIQQIFHKHGMVATESERVKKLNAKVLEINGTIANGLMMLNRTMNEFLQEDELTFDNKNKLLSMIQHIEEEFQLFDELKSLIKK